MKKSSVALVCMLALAFAANAKPARSVFRTFVQPDGTTVTAKLVGDEFSHWYEDTDGNPLLMEADGIMRPADMTKLKEIRAIGIERRMNAEEMRRPLKAPAKAAAAPQYGLGLFTTNYPRKGDVHSLVFLIEYSDVAFKTPNAHQYFTDLLNKDGFDEYGGTGCAAEYYREQSHNAFRPVFDVYGPVKLSQKRAYYGGNDSYGQDLRPEKMVTEAAALLADQIDFSKYDYDNDGKVDNIYIFYAGEGEAGYGTADCVWPHSYQIPNGPTYNGKKIYGYACSNEVENGVPDGMGTFCHEYSHVLGLPDLYDPYYVVKTTPGKWTIMDSGCYNNDSRTPPHYSSFERNAMGWMEPVIVDAPESVTLEDLGKSNVAYLIPTKSSNEFYLLENRQQEGWDKYLPYHGMLVWHIDFDQDIWNRNVVNSNKSHQYVDLVEANNRPISAESLSQLSLRGYPFPGTSSKTSFTSETTPALKDWAGNSIQYPITDIKEIDGVITFNIAGGDIVFDKPAAPTLQAAVDGTITATWAAVDRATYYVITVDTADGQNVGVFKTEDASTSYVINGLQGETTYNVRLQAGAARSVSEYSDAATVTTPEIDFTFTAPLATRASVEGKKIVFEWNYLKHASSYLITIEKETTDGYTYTVVNFGESADKQLTIPEGWNWSQTLTSCYQASATNYFGEAAPSAKFSVSGAYLESPVFEDEIKQVSYWLRGSNANYSNTFDLQGRSSDKDNWTSLSLLTGLSAYNSAGTTITNDLGSDVHQIRLEYTKVSGNLAVDDIKVGVAAKTFMNIHDRTDVGSNTSFEIDTPAESGCVRFFVEGRHSDGRISLPSNKLELTFDNNSAITDVKASDIDVKVYGNTVVYTGNDGDTVKAYTASGTLAASATTLNGIASFELPAGFYIIASQAGAVKVYVK